MNETGLSFPEAPSQIKIFVPLSRDVAAALFELAILEGRSPKQQAGWLIKRELERLGLLHSVQSSGQEEEARARNP